MLRSSLSSKGDNLMAATSCLKCGGTTFEFEDVDPIGGSVTMLSVQCMQCGTSIGVTDQTDPADELRPLLEGQREEIADLKKRLSTMARTVDAIHDILSKMLK